ncbi:MAG: ABC transporter permease [Acidimicrobiales bacterium]
MSVVIETRTQATSTRGRRVRDIAHAIGSRSWLIWVAFLAFIVICAVFGAKIAPHDPLEQSLLDRLKPPFSTTDNGFHFLGTDALGRDLFSQVIKGARLTVFIATVSMLIGSVIGISLGMAAGFYGGIVDRLIMRLAEAQTAMPMFLVAILLIILLGPNVINLVLILPTLVWPTFARIVRAETLRLRETPFIEAAVAVGCTGRSIMWHHLRPNLLSRIVVLGVISTGQVILAEAGLSFLGAGVQPPDTTWGLLIADGRQYLATSWWLTITPGIVLGLTVLSLNMLGRRYANLAEARR